MELEPAPRPRGVRKRLTDAQKTQGEIELDDLYGLLRRSTFLLTGMLIMVLASTVTLLLILLSKGA